MIKALLTLNKNDINDDDCRIMTKLLNIDAYNLDDDKFIEIAKKVDWVSAILAYAGGMPIDYYIKEPIYKIEK